ncbi:tRNA glutamyl-Q(34) synthetase GluQRS [Pseudoruegeria sp. SHC-113]|uniref:tRNA glutamyl-Q(34) synthetase GluQRS n=1 Tax=Pseudoruegeria sp. SHC-113 TaxID=2855439 RepID=UPI0021BAFD8B|nr:tRNA glutamyl-Q(34) synthetase GluQRS [Pseudoruegeria sp. SHC-113]MCT8160506.1 tRNA glutamyl-Q(34) synthetase GluQRS [Pseudoruegeria sp. SHC-113]
MSFATRFAPSPTGPLHLGHAYSALFAHDLAAAAGGRFLLRIEDIDQSRARPEWETLIYEDLTWLGLTWETPVLRQSDQMPRYSEALETLWNQGLLYPCSCNRRDILTAATAPQEGGDPLVGPDGIIYPGTCRATAPRGCGVLPEGAALRLDMAAALARLGWAEVGVPERLYTRGNALKTAPEMIETIGDIVLSRRDMGTSYHLSVVLDDAHQGVTDVVRGEDLFEASFIHVLLQGLLGLPTPRYHHHGLIRDEAGKRLAKRDDAKAIRKFREEGASPADIRAMVGL